MLSNIPRSFPSKIKNNLIEIFEEKLCAIYVDASIYLVKVEVRNFTHFKTKNIPMSKGKFILI